ncbi:MAG: hypothetical protein HY818_05305 [Acetobacterium woodii]|nr:hypothetical protein [Acetobacterium woodii]
MKIDYRSKTPELEMRVSGKTVEVKLAKLINNNFKAGDAHIDLTYRRDQKLTKEECKRELKKFLDKTKEVYKRRGYELKYITVTEYKSREIHHHLIINMVNSIKAKELNKIWEKGRIRFICLDDTGQYGALAHYLAKEGKKNDR